VRNGQPVDDSPPSSGIALADLDGDGSDELIASTPDGVLIVVGLADVAMANPEHPPPANGFRLDAGPQPGAVAAADVDGDGRLDVIALDQAEAVARVYHHRGAGAGDFDAAQTIALPSTGAQVVASGCAEAPARVRLDGGAVVALTAAGRATPWLDGTQPIAELAAAPDALAAGARDQLTLFDACAQSSLQVSLGGAALALARSSDAERLAVLAPDGTSVTLYAVLGF
jgi:hypothetical protein